MLVFKDLAQQALAQGASDVVIAVGAPVMFRASGALSQADRTRLVPTDVDRLANQLLTESQRQRLDQGGEIDVSHSLLGIGRFRVSAFYQRGTLGLVIRVIPTTVPQATDLGLPHQAIRLTTATGGLIMVAGPPASGRTTTVAALCELLLNHRCMHLITLEKPVEYLLRHGKSVVHQREVGSDTASFESGLRSVARQAADVIMLSQLQPAWLPDTLELTGAGTLVLAAVAGRSACDALSRLVLRLPPADQDEARRRLAESVRGVICQQLIPGQAGARPQAVFEVLDGGGVAAAHIAAGHWDRLQQQLADGLLPGSLPMSQALANLAAAGSITESEHMRRIAALGDSGTGA